MGQCCTDKLKSCQLYQQCSYQAPSVFINGDFTEPTSWQFLIVICNYTLSNIFFLWDITVMDYYNEIYSDWMCLHRSLTDFPSNFLHNWEAKSAIIQRLPRTTYPSHTYCPGISENKWSQLCLTLMMGKVLVNSSLLILKEVSLHFTKQGRWLLLLQYVFKFWKYFLWSSIKPLLTLISETQIYKVQLKWQKSTSAYT